MITTLDDINAKGRDFLYVLDLNHMTWTQFSQQTGLSQFAQGPSGLLLDGPPPPGARKTATMMPNSK
jgi:hypothetical protein